MWIFFCSKNFVYVASKYSKLDHTVPQSLQTVDEIFLYISPSFSVVAIGILKKIFQIDFSNVCEKFYVIFQCFFLFKSIFFLLFYYLCYICFFLLRTHILFLGFFYDNNIISSVCLFLPFTRNTMKMCERFNFKIQLCFPSFFLNIHLIYLFFSS